MSFEDNWPALMQWYKQFRILTTLDAEQDQGGCYNYTYIVGSMLIAHAFAPGRVWSTVQGKVQEVINKVR